MALLRTYRILYLCSYEFPLFLPFVGLSDEEIELALQQSGTAHDDPPPLGTTGLQHPGPPHQLAIQPYRKWRLIITSLYMSTIVHSYNENV